MSGGHFEYNQHKIQDIIGSIEDILRNKRKHNKKWDYIENDYTDKTFEELETSLKILRKAHIYTQRIDWLISGDDGEDSFHERLDEDLKVLEGED